MTALLALVLAAAPGCPEALAGAAASTAEDLAAHAPAIVQALEDAGAGGPTAALAAAARAIEAAGPELRARDAAAAAFRGALARHCVLASAPLAPDASAADRAALAEILARPELSLSRSDPYALRRALERLWEWLVEQLGTGEAERYASLGRALFLGVAVGAAVLAGSALLRRRERRAAARAAAERGPEPRTGADPSAAEAEAALHRGDARGAVRFALLAALGALERAGRVPRGRALTNEEVILAAATPTATVTPTATLVTDLTALARLFDRTVYGGLPVATEEARAALERALRIVSAAGAAP